MNELRLSFVYTGYDILLNRIWLTDQNGKTAMLCSDGRGTHSSSGGHYCGDMVSFVLKNLSLDDGDTDANRIRDALLHAVGADGICIEVIDADTRARVPQLLLTEMKFATDDCVYDLTNNLKLPRQVVAIPTKLMPERPAADGSKLVGMASVIQAAMEDYMNRRAEISNDTMAMFVARRLSEAGIGYKT